MYQFNNGDTAARHLAARVSGAWNIGLYPSVLRRFASRRQNAGSTCPREMKRLSRRNDRDEERSPRTYDNHYHDRWRWPPFAKKLPKSQYVTVDTEFLRERTYYSKLCLVQLAVPGEAEDDAVLVDPLAKGLSLDPLYKLMADESVVKVFHAARQDIEIFWVSRASVIPKPLFDTQVAAMVAGFGEQVGYETLVRKIAKAQLDKSSRFTDWSRRPLTEAQQTYALADVTHLRVHLRTSGRRAGTIRPPCLGWKRNWAS